MQGLGEQRVPPQRLAITHPADSEVGRGEYPATVRGQLTGAGAPS